VDTNILFTSSFASLGIVYSAESFRAQSEYFAHHLKGQSVRWFFCSFDPIYKDDLRSKIFLVWSKIRRDNIDFMSLVG
jgi:Zn-finger protein